VSELDYCRMQEEERERKKAKLKIQKRKLSVDKLLKNLDLPSDIPKEAFREALKKCSHGTHPTFAFNSVGLGDVYNSLKSVADVMPEAYEAFLYNIIISFYYDSIDQITNTLFKIATDKSQGSIAIQAAKMLLEFEEHLHNRESPIVLRSLT